MNNGSYLTKAHCDDSRCYGDYNPKRPQKPGIMYEQFASNGPGSGVPILFLCWRHAGDAYRSLKAAQPKQR